MEKIKHLLQNLPPWILSIVCFLAICWLTLAPKPLGDNDIPLFPGADKIVHAIMFGGFTFCIILDWCRRRNWQSYPNTIKICMIAPVLPCLLGVATEILQNSMNLGRSGDEWDLVADFAGSFCVAAGFLCIQYFNAKRQ